MAPALYRPPQISVLCFVRHKLRRSTITTSHFMSSLVGWVERSATHHSAPSRCGASMANTKARIVLLSSAPCEKIDRHSPSIYVICIDLIGCARSARPVSATSVSFVNVEYFPELKNYLTEQLWWATPCSI